MVIVIQTTGLGHGAAYLTMAGALVAKGNLEWTEGVLCPNSS